MDLHRTETYDLVVAGGGLAGVCAAVAAARYGRTMPPPADPSMAGWIATTTS